MTDRKPLTYRDAGVNIDAGDALVDTIKPVAARTHRPGVMGSLGGFGGLFHLDPERFQDPVLVSGTDGVGTKLKLAFETGVHDTIGIDLVAMCANDIIVQGAEPLFFLDYFACGKLDPDVAARVVAGIGRGCELAGAALLGGETAEMPDMYADGEYDLGGFVVGAVERAQLIDGTRVKAGDRLLGLRSSGVHSNGFSLVRKILERTGLRLDDAPFGDRAIGEVLLEPTIIYVKPVLQTLGAHAVSALAHITGGGLPDNVARVIPAGLSAVIDASSWERPELFRWLQAEGNVPNDDMWRTFNCGIGMVLVVRADDANAITQTLNATDVDVVALGQIEEASDDRRVIISGQG